MTNEKEGDSFLMDLLDDPLDKLIIQLLDLEEHDEDILDKILSSGVQRRD